MPSAKNLRPYQPRLPLAKAVLWDKLPEPTRARVRQLLTQMLERLMVNPESERSNHERED